MSEPHSAEFFGEQRDFWWNRDFLDLMAARWRLNEASSLADIGCGRCHWSRLWYPYLRKPARLTGVDREPKWVEEAGPTLRRAFPEAAPDSFAVLQGEATKIPLPDNAFDVVTCQTVLMHLDQPLAALREMLRILRTGGLLVCAEPNNFWNYLPTTSLTADEPTEDVVRRFEFWLRHHRGRKAAGLGEHGIGDLLPGYFVQLGVREVQVHLNDRVSPLYPPYHRPEQQASIRQEQEWLKSGSGPWDRAELRRLFLLGGGTEAEFERGFKAIHTQHVQEQSAIAGKTFHAAYGALHYLVSGRKC